jgi:uncharacterized protein YbaR (Trm112 family)
MPNDPKLEQTQRQLAMFLARKDALDHKMLSPENPDNYRVWDEVPTMGQEEYLKDAEQIMQALMILGFGPVAFAQLELLNLMHTNFRKLMFPPAILRWLTDYIKALKTEIDNNAQ